ncbi:MAG TPA: biliverdin-producing heme oxygenase [Kofleriaceae bacterium]|jgi:heme oxygenase
MIDRLNVETAAFHADADVGRDALFQDDFNPRAYRDFLALTYGFETPLETALALSAQLDQLLDLKARSRGHLIAQDLMRLGWKASTVAELPMCLTVPSFRSAAEALGWMYVSERAALAHQVARRHLLSRFPTELTCASNYLEAGGGLLGQRWRQFGAVLDQISEHPAVAERVVGAAHDAFRCFIRWTTRGKPILRRPSGAHRIVA